MIPQSKNQPINAETTPKDQVAATRRALRDMSAKADRAADEQVARSTRMT
jgi:hypothetical protein